MTALPAADPLLVAHTVEALPARLRARLDAALARAGEWVVEDDVVRLPTGGEVVLRPEEGVLRHPANVVCGCLLAPACLHRAAVLAAAPVATAALAAAGSEESPPAEPEPAVEPWSPRERSAAALVAAAAERILESGLQGAGAAVQAELLRAVHEARLRGLHRLAAAATRVVTGVRAGRAEDASFVLASLSRDLLEVLEVCSAVARGADDPGTWRGRARTTYAQVGGLRLAGLCLEPVVSGAGYAGVVVWLVDEDGRTWSVSDVKPGGPERLAASAGAPVAVGGTTLTHWQLSRAGLLLSGATANSDGRLGSGAAVRGAPAAGVPWEDERLRPRFGPLGQGRLLLLDLVVCGADPQGLRAVDVAGNGLRLVPPRSATQIARANLQLLARAPGLRLLAVGRPGGGVRSVELLAVGGGDLQLPPALGGHADLGIDALSSAQLAVAGPPPPWPGVPEVEDPLGALRRRIERAVAGGRTTLTVGAAGGDVQSEVAALRRAQLGTGADVLQGLAQAAQFSERDVFGRVDRGGSVVFAQRWLAAGVYVRAFEHSLSG